MWIYLRLEMDLEIYNYCPMWCTLYRALPNNINGRIQSFLSGRWTIKFKLAHILGGNFRRLTCHLCSPQFNGYT